MTADLRVLDATCSHDGCEGRGTYVMSGHCSNCGWKGTVTFTKGHTSDAARCARCETKNVRTKGLA